MGFKKRIRIALIGGPDDGAVVDWSDAFPPSRWLTDIRGETGPHRLRALYRPVKADDGNSYLVRADGTHVYSYEGQEQT